MRRWPTAVLALAVCGVLGGCGSSGSDPSSGGSITLYSGQHEQTVEITQLPLDPNRPGGIHPQPGRIEAATRDGQQVTDAIDSLYPRGRIVDGRRQRAYRGIDELPEAERRILHEGTLPADEEKSGDIAVLKVPAVHERDEGAVSQVFAHSYGQLEPAPLLPTQFDQTVQVSGGDDAGRPGVADAMWRGIRPGRLDVNVG